MKRGRSYSSHNGSAKDAKTSSVGTQHFLGNKITVKIKKIFKQKLEKNPKLRARRWNFTGVSRIGC